MISNFDGSLFSDSFIIPRKYVNSIGFDDLAIGIYHRYIFMGINIDDFIMKFSL